MKLIKYPIMKKIKTLLLLLFIVFSLQAQDKSYRAERTKINDLVHTKLKVSFDFAKRQMPAEAWITLKPHFYPTNKLTLDAKAMQINSVKRNGKDLKYTYDGKQLHINLGNTFTNMEEYTVYINYIAKPEEVKSKGSVAITDEKGLYFIDPDGTDPDRPTEIWTQGETEATSVWCPTIDSPNQKTTQEIYMTVPSKYVTLSNGLLTSKVENKDGTRTDHWEMKLKHAPYLFFMGVGDFSIVNDSYNEIPIDYYVDKEYEPYAREIFGKTPKMMKVFEKLTGVKYPWSKYAQMVGYDYVSGAMENTTATLHGTMAYQTSGELIDKNSWEDIIAHELFHHWFGDLVTCESWANLTINESFANYSEYLWREAEYGKDHADQHRHEDLEGYFMGGNENKKLVRFHYGDEMEMFDAVSYNKGGAILHMLRNYLGDKAFFTGLKEYLNENKFGTAEVHQLRLALEKISGRDLNWFFNQWYFDSNHLNLDINYGYDAEKETATMTVKQTGKIFNMPVKINVYENNQPKTYEIWLSKAEETFGFKVKNKPKLIDFDIDKTLIAKIKDNKTTENYIFQYENAPSYENRLESLEKLATNKSNSAIKTLAKGLDDSYFGLRIVALEKIDLSDKTYSKLIKKVKNMASNDAKTLVKAAAIKTLSPILKKSDITMLQNNLSSKSFAVKRNALSTLYKLDREKGLEAANKITDPNVKKNMKDALMEIFVAEKNTTQLPFMAKHIISGMFMSRNPEAQEIYANAYKMLIENDNLKAAEIFIKDAVKTGIQYKKYGADKMLLQLLNNFKGKQETLNGTNKEIILKKLNTGIKKLK